MFELVLNNAMQVARDQIPGSVELFEKFSSAQSAEEPDAERICIISALFESGKVGAHSEV